jgi:hypothetical protein
MIENDDNLHIKEISILRYVMKYKIQFNPNMEVLFHSDMETK